MPSLPDHHVRLVEHRGGNRQAEVRGGLQVDDQVERGRRLDGQVRRLRPLQDSLHVVRHAPVEGRQVRAVGDETTRLGKVLGYRSHRQRVLRREIKDRPPVLRDRRIIEHGERFGTRAGGGLEGCRKVARPADGQAQHLEPQRGAGPCHLLHNAAAAQIVRIIEHGHAREARQELREQLEPLGGEVVGQKTSPGHIAPRMGQTRDEAGFHGIRDAHDHNGHRGRGLLGRLRGRGIHGQDDIHLAPYKLVDQRAQPLVLPLRIP